MACAYGMPVLQSYYSLMQRYGAGESLEDPCLETGLFWLSKDLPKHHAVPITDEARESFEHAFGISPSLQLELEKYYDGLDLRYRGSSTYEGLTAAHLI